LFRNYGHLNNSKKLSISVLTTWSYLLG
jgi:hypothetical protein